jgi:ATP-dependent RNA helicase DeaD
MNRFKRMGIIEPILRVIEEQGFREPTRIQERTIPLVLSGKDVIGGSATGSGKTLAFGEGIIQNTRAGEGIRSLVLTPTRELAQQVSKSLKLFSKYKPLSIACVYGGAAINPQIEKLKTADAVVGTPGRILDHLQRGTLNLSRVSILVLDEADRMLDMGFVDDVERIIRQCPRHRQTLLFSATITYEVARLSGKYMTNPRKVSAETYIDPRHLIQVYYDVPDNIKFSLLVHLLKHEKADLAMVFSNTRSNTDFLANNLKLNGINAMAIHGGFSQDKRDRSMEDFHAKNVHVLVCTDVAARGLDIKGVSHIYNYDIPKDSKDYIHRIGRTARAGKDGKVINLLSQRDWDSFRKAIRNNEMDIEKEYVPPIERARIGWKNEPRYGPGGYHRGGRPPRGSQTKRHPRKHYQR